MVVVGRTSWDPLKDDWGRTLQERTSRAIALLEPVWGSVRVIDGFGDIPPRNSVFITVYRGSQSIFAELGKALGGEIAVSGSGETYGYEPQCRVVFDDYLAGDLFGAVGLKQDYLRLWWRDLCASTPGLTAAARRFRADRTREAAEHLRALTSLDPPAPRPRPPRD